MIVNTKTTLLNSRPAPLALLPSGSPIVDHPKDSFSPKGDPGAPPRIPSLMTYVKTSAVAEGRRSQERGRLQTILLGSAGLAMGMAGGALLVVPASAILSTPILQLPQLLLSQHTGLQAAVAFGIIGGAAGIHSALRIGELLGKTMGSVVGAGSGLVKGLKAHLTQSVIPLEALPLRPEKIRAGKLGILLGTSAMTPGILAAASLSASLGATGAGIALGATAGAAAMFIGGMEQARKLRTLLSR